MRLLVVADVHGRLGDLLDAIDSQPEARHVFCLGDGVEQYEDAAALYPDRHFHIVRGNCDPGAHYPTFGEIVLGGVTIVYTHGHVEHVKYGLETAIEVARTHGADLLLYGHTHVQHRDYEDGLHIFNPGSVGYRGQYGVVDITPNGQLMTSGITL